MKTNKAIIIGATSGIGKELATMMINDDWEVGLTGRRASILTEIQQQHPQQVYIQTHDVTQITSTDDSLNQLFDQLKYVDLIIVSSGFAEINYQLEWALEDQMIQTNVNGTAKVYGWAFEKFKQQGHGHLVGISSIASIRGNRHSPAYGASKAFQSSYLEALRGISVKGKLNIKVTDIQPGFVDTPMAQGNGLFWVAPVDKATRQIYRAILKKQRKAYITRRWALVAFILKRIPRAWFEKI